MKYAVNDTVEVIHTGSTDFGKTGTIRRIVQAARSTFYCPHCQKT